MTKRICSILDCGRRHKGYGFCEAHLDRWKRHGNPLHGGPVVVRGIYSGCTVPECGRPHKGHGFCEAHLRRWKEYGDPLRGGPIRTKGLLSECVVDGCASPIKGNRYCSKHWQKQRKYGDPLGGQEYHWAKGEFKQWLLEQPDTTECIEPKGFKYQRPVIILDGTMHNASRGAWILRYGNPGDQFVLHTCDNDRCVNLRHLYLGDQWRNIRDTLVRERRRSRFLFSNADVVRIRSLRKAGRSPRRIAEEYGVDVARVYALLQGRTYRHVD